LFFLIIPALLFLVLYSPNVHGPVDLFHEGEALAPAFEISHGKLPFRDVYLQHGWGVNAFRAQLAFLLFGESVAAHRRLSYGASGLLVPIAWIGVYLLLYSLFEKKVWILPILLLLALADVLITDRHLLPFLSFALLMSAVRGRRRFLLIAGALAGAAIFYSLDTGVYAFVIGILFLAACSIGDRSRSASDFGKSIVVFLAGAIAASLPFLLYLLGHGLLDDFFSNIYLQLRYQQETWGIAPPSAASLLGPFENATVRNRTFYVFIKWYFPALVYVITLIALLPVLRSRSLHKKDLPIALVLLMGIVFYPSALGRADEGHLMYAVAPFWILGVCFLSRAGGLKNEEVNAQSAFRYRRLLFSRTAAILVIVGFALYFWATCRNGGALQQRYHLARWKQSGMPGFVELNIERSGGIKVPAQQAKDIEETVAFINQHTQPDDPVFDFSNQGIYYFLSGRQNSTMFCQTAYAIPARLQAKALEQLRASPPAVVIMREEAAYNPRRRQPAIDEWLQTEYEEAARIGPNIILLPAQRS